MKNDFKGNKKFLPSKPCTRCGRTMTWRRAWARNWDSVRYCSDACRSKKGGNSAGLAPARPAPAGNGAR
jgi:hypothetical protein